MADVKISALTDAVSVNGTDELPIVQGGVTKRATINEVKAGLSLAKADVGLGNVDNTSDVDKPVSTATSTALSGKSNTGHSHVSTDITDFNSATRAQTEAELAAGTNITITPSGTGATRVLTIASTGGASYDPSNAEIITPVAMAALAIDVTKTLNTKTIAADSTFTFSATPTTNAWFGMHLTNSDTNPHVITIPSSFSVARQAAITSFVIPASGQAYITWRYDGSTYRVFGDSPYRDKMDATADPTTGDDVADGFGPGSLWGRSDNGTFFWCENNAAGAAVWNQIGGAGGATNLSYTASATNGIVTSDTGTDAILPLSDGTIAGLMAPAQHSKLVGIATGATANSSDATLLARANHTGTQTASTISDFNTAADARIAAANLAAKSQAVGGSWVFPTVADSTTLVMLKAPYAFTITEIAAKTTTGTCTVQVTIEGTNVTGGSVAASSTEASSTATAANTVAAGNDVALVISSNASAANLTVTLAGTRTLA